MNGKISLIVKNDKLNFEEITSLLLINPTRIVKKGEIVSKVIAPSICDVWIYEERFTTNEELNSKIYDMFNCYRYDNLEKISQACKVELKCFLQSEDAQINFELYPVTIEIISKLKIKFRVSILSWGKA